jgi:chemotaxis protein MotB
VVKREKLEDAIKVKVTEKGIAIKVADPIGFDVGEARIRPEFMALLREITKNLRELPQSHIRVEGHTDNIPIRTPKYPSNWELSAARALNVVKFFARHGFDPARLSAVGYGQYRPVADNDTPRGRQRNRRIEIYVDYTKKEK